MSSVNAAQQDMGLFGFETAGGKCAAGTAQQAAPAAVVIAPVLSVGVSNAMLPEEPEPPPTGMVTHDLWDTHEMQAIQAEQQSTAVPRPQMPPPAGERPRGAKASQWMQAAVAQQ